jgi:uncharacterized protein (DUF433 family)
MFGREKADGYDNNKRGAMNMVTVTEHVYIVRDEGILSGEPIVKGTRTPVRAIVETWRLGIAAEDITTHLPHLSLAQVFDALSYFADHPEEIKGHMERNQIPAEKLHKRTGTQ